MTPDPDSVSRSDSHSCNWTIRPAGERDYAGITLAETDRGPEPVAEIEVREWDIARRKDREYPSEWFVAIDVSGDGAGEAFLGWGYWCKNSWAPPGEREVYVAVPGVHRGRGVGTYLLDYLERMTLRDKPTALCAWGRGTDAASIDWALRRGYAVERRRTEGILDLTSFDFSAFQSNVDAVKAAGFQIVTVWDDQMKPYLPGMYKIDIETSRDVPFRSQDAAETGYETWLLEYSGSPARKMIALALWEGEVAGFTNIYMPLIEGQSAGIGYTGVQRQYRGKGLALALKVVASVEATRAGAKLIRTQNDPDNPAILRINEKLGYRQVPGPVILKKPLGHIR